MKHLLMASDLSDRSTLALARAVAIAREHGAALTVLHVVDEALPQGLRATQETVARQMIGDQIAELNGGSAAVQAAIEIVEGRAYNAILETADKTGSELIVLGMHRENTFKDMFRSTVAERIIRTGQIPTLLVKAPADQEYRNILVGMDFSVAARHALGVALGLAPGGSFHLVHAYDVPFQGFMGDNETRAEIGQEQQAKLEAMVEEEMKVLLASLSPATPRLIPTTDHGSVRQVLHRQIARLEPDLMVLGTHGRTGAAHTLLGSVAEEFLASPPCDVLAVKAW